MRYRTTSHWNEKNEIRCLIIFKKLQAENFPRGKQTEYCREMSRLTNIEPIKIISKVSDYKAAARVNFASNASVKAIEQFKKYGQLPIEKLEKLVG
jgi:hypothetical protein